MDLDSEVTFEYKGHHVHFYTTEESIPLSGMPNATTTYHHIEIDGKDFTQRFAFGSDIQQRIEAVKEFIDDPPPNAL